MKSKTYEGIFNQSGVIPYREKNSTFELLIITSRNGRKWIFPKGIIASDLTSEESAAKEAYEEAGVEGEVFPKSIGAYTYTKWGDKCRVELYTMRVQKTLKKWPESNFRERKWVSYNAALNLVQPNALRKILKKFPDFLEFMNLSIIFI